jgi:hypothetical protein
MKTKVGFTFCALALGVSACLFVRADDSAKPRLTGRVLILDNERTLEGEIERRDDQYRIHRAVGELLVPAENVLYLCNTMEEAYTFLRSSANLRDPDEHVRLAKWCQLRGLKNQAAQEAREAVELRPNHAASRRLLQNLEHAIQSQHTSPGSRPQEDAENALAAPDVDADSLSLFVTRVQPTLMNACASCHASGRGGSFKLIRIYERGATSRRTTYQNLAAVLAQVNREQYQLSLLLAKAATVHGDMAQPAIKNREAPAFQTLERWVKITVESNQVVRGQAAPSSSPATNPESMPASQPVAVKPDPVAPSPSGSGTKQPNSQPPAGGQEVGTPSSTQPPNEPVDPFDPVIFNRQIHPQPKPEPKK